MNLQRVEYRKKSVNFQYLHTIQHERFRSGIELLQPIRRMNLKQRAMYRILRGLHLAMIRFSTVLGVNQYNTDRKLYGSIREEETLVLEAIGLTDATYSD
jgi:hypothetical protein